MYLLKRRFHCHSGPCCLSFLKLENSTDTTEWEKCEGRWWGNFLLLLSRTLHTWDGLLKRISER